MHIRKLPAGSTVHYVDREGVETVGYIIKVVDGIGYSVVPLFDGQRTLVPIEALRT